MRHLFPINTHARLKCIDYIAIKNSCLYYNNDFVFVICAFFPTSIHMHY